MNQRTIQLSRQAIRRYKQERQANPHAPLFVLVGIQYAIIIVLLAIK